MSRDPLTVVDQRRSAFLTDWLIPLPVLATAARLSHGSPTRTCPAQSWRTCKLRISAGQRHYTTASVGKTKEVDRFRRLVIPQAPRNFRWVFSLGGAQDSLLDPWVDRVADVFPTEAAIEEVGWHSQRASDLLAVLGPAPVGMAANPIPALRNRLGDRRLSDWQAEIDEFHARRRRTRHSTIQNSPDEL